MYKSVLIAGLGGLVALSGCSQTEEPAAVDDTAVAEPADTAALTQPPPGTYEVTDADGKVTMTTINADGTYMTMDGETMLSSGTVARVDGKDCFDPEGDETGMCYMPGEPDADGVFSVTSDDGKVETVRPISG